MWSKVRLKRLKTSAFFERRKLQIFSTEGTVAPMWSIRIFPTGLGVIYLQLVLELFL